LINHVLTRKSQLDVRTPEPGSGIWAPTIREHNGEFFVTVCSFDRYRPQADDRVWPRGFVVRSKDLWKKDGFSDPVYFDMIGFDQDVSRD
jgi:beta-xylosidase